MFDKISPRLPAPVPTEGGAGRLLPLFAKEGKKSEKLN
jgi:hypothetical protein